jgi:hypothetical protein
MTCRGRCPAVSAIASGKVAGPNSISVSNRWVIIWSRNQSVSRARAAIALTGS